MRSAIVQQAEARKLTRFLTLTLDPSKVVGDDFKYLRASWRKMRVYLSRRFGESVEFIAVVELHRSGRPHLHVLVNRFIPQDWLSRAWESVGGGRVVDIRYVDVHNVGRYLSKYFTKQTAGALPSGLRRVSASKGIVFFVKGEKMPGGFLCTLTVDMLRDYAEGVRSEQWTDAGPPGERNLTAFIAEVCTWADTHKFEPHGSLKKIMMLCDRIEAQRGQ